MNYELSNGKIKMSEEHRMTQIQHNHLNIPTQLDQFEIDFFVQPYFCNRGWIVTENKLCRKKLNCFKSIAERLIGKIFQKPLTRNQRGWRARHLFSHVTVETIKSFALSEDFFDVWQILDEEIIPFWDLKDFVEFFFYEVERICTKKQFEGMHNQLMNYNNHKLKQIMNLRPQRSIKQQFREQKY
mgnify:CR=1 FL=1